MTDPKKVEAVKNFEAPTHLKSLLRFLGMVCWYGRFIKNLGTTAAPLHELLKKVGPDDPPLIWEIKKEGTDQNIAFNTLKEKLCERPILRLPDYKKPFYVISDMELHYVRRTMKALNYQQHTTVRP